MLIDDEYRDSVEILGDLLDAQTHVQNPAPVPSFAQRMDDAGSVDILSKLYDEHAADQAVAHELSQETAPPPSTSIDLLSEAAFPTIDDQHDHAIEHAPQYSPAQFSDEDADALVSSMERRPHHVEIDIETDGSSGIDPDSLLEAVVRATSSQPHNQHTETEIDDGDESGVQHGYGYAPMSTEILVRWYSKARRLTSTPSNVLLRTCQRCATSRTVRCRATGRSTSARRAHPRAKCSRSTPIRSACSAARK